MPYYWTNKSFMKAHLIDDPIDDQPPQPIRIPGRKMAENWWGKAWDDNLESYSDYSNRLPRGRTYARNGSIIDLRINEGFVEARVRGSAPYPYQVEINIKPLSDERKAAIAQRCANRVQNIDALVRGQMPEDVADLFRSRNGLFPSPSEISFRCSCPDWASMCKHVAAVMYGIGKRLDEQPMMFFSLRGIEVAELVSKTVEEKIGLMLENSGKPSDRIIGDDELDDLFGRI